MDPSRIEQRADGWYFRERAFGPDHRLRERDPWVGPYGTREEAEGAMGSSDADDDQAEKEREDKLWRD